MEKLAVGQIKEMIKAQFGVVAHGTKKEMIQQYEKLTAEGQATPQARQQGSQVTFKGQTDFHFQNTHGKGKNRGCIAVWLFFTAITVCGAALVLRR